MTNKIEQKKEYTAPTMKMIELKRQENLLQCSGCNDDTVNVEFIK